MHTRYRKLIQTLNGRYQEQFDRAERLEAELRHLRCSRLWKLCSWVREALNWFRRSSRPVVSPLEPFSSQVLTPVAVAGGSVTIIIPFRDRYELLRNVLTSLRRTSYTNFQIQLVDNGSREKRIVRFLERVQQRQRYRVMHCDEPFNFSRLCNLGAAAASSDLLLFLNNDVEVLSPSWLDDMLRLAALPEVGVVGATLLYPDRTIQHAGIAPRTDGEWTHLYRGTPAEYRGENNELLRPRSVPAVTGACLMIRRDLFNAMAGFDESLPVIMNDVELCQRVRRRGLLVAISPQARLWHFESLSRGFHKCSHATV